MTAFFCRGLLLGHGLPGFTKVLRLCVAVRFRLNSFGPKIVAISAMSKGSARLAEVGWFGDR
jgi:hypothetical protein